jgi:hypothetical protein
MGKGVFNELYIGEVAGKSMGDNDFLQFVMDNVAA